MAAAPRRLKTNYTTLTWSASGSSVTKTRNSAHGARRRFRYELRINKLLREEHPPLATPLLLHHYVQHRSLTFETVSGETIGPKYPHDLSPDQVDVMIELADRVQDYRPRRHRWFRRLNSTNRLAQARRHGLLTPNQTTTLQKLAQRTHTRYQFCHGDITARNVMQHEGSRASVLIDWEWAGLYPVGYDHAFLWFSLIDTNGGRDQVEQAIPTGEERFLLSALLIQLWHLQWFTPPEFRPKHLATRDEMLQRLGA